MSSTPDRLDNCCFITDNPKTLVNLTLRTEHFWERTMRTTSWVLLLLVGILVVLGGIGSAVIAYLASGETDMITESISLNDMNVSQEASTALRGRRGTAAAYALGFAVLMLWVIVGPYRKGEIWSWWAILCSTTVLAAVIMLRIPSLNSSRGAMTGLLLLIVVVVALLLDVRRLMGSQD
jgi:hypothetical protein